MLTCLEVEGDLSRHSSHSEMDLEGCTLEEEALDDPSPMPSPMKQDQEQEEEQAFRGWTSEEQERGEKEKERLDHTFLLSMGLEEQEAGRRAVSLGQVRGAGRLGGRLWVLGVGGVGVRLVVWLALVAVTLGQVRGAGG